MHMIWKTWEEELLLESKDIAIYNKVHFQRI